MEDKKNSLNLNDFTLVVNIIDACTERGSFKGNELSIVAQLREKFVSFIDENNPEEQMDTTEEEKED